MSLNNSSQSKRKPSLQFNKSFNLARESTFTKKSNLSTLQKTLSIPHARLKTVKPSNKKKKDYVSKVVEVGRKQ